MTHLTSPADAGPLPLPPLRGRRGHHEQARRMSTEVCLDEMASEALQPFEHGGDLVVGHIGEGHAHETLLARAEHVARDGQQVLLVGQPLGYSVERWPSKGCST